MPAGGSGTDAGKSGSEAHAVGGPPLLLPAVPGPRERTRPGEGEDGAGGEGGEERFHGVPSRAGKSRRDAQASPGPS